MGKGRDGMVVESNEQRRKKKKKNGGSRWYEGEEDDQHQANLHHSKTFKSSLFSQSSANETISPTLFFEVTKPINLPATRPCSLTALQHDFGFTYGKPPVLADYNFPSDCPFQEFSKIVLEWNATCKGRQFDRIFGVWLSGVELLRSCTAEPRPNGIFWS
ncbi:hypothetical protein Gotur_022599, partial [Gossypium turneri]